MEHVFKVGDLVACPKGARSIPLAEARGFGIRIGEVSRVGADGEPLQVRLLDRSEVTVTEFIDTFDGPIVGVVIVTPAGEFLVGGFDDFAAQSMVPSWARTLRVLAWYRVWEPAFEE